MQYHAIPCNAMQYHAIPCNTMQYHALPCNTVKYHAIQCKYHTIQCNTMHYHAIPCIINNCWRSVPLPCGQFNGHFFLYQTMTEWRKRQTRGFHRHVTWLQWWWWSMVMVTMVMVTMMTMTLVVWESSKCIAHMNHSPLSATLSFYDYSGHSASDRINYFERKILVTHKYIYTHL